MAGVVSIGAADSGYIRFADEAGVLSDGDGRTREKRFEYSFDDTVLAIASLLW